MGRVLDLLEDIWLALFYQVVKLLLSSELVDFQLPLQLLLLLNLLLRSLQIPLQVQQEVRLLDHFQPPLQFVVLLHEIDNGFICVLKFSFGDAHSTPMDRARTAICWRSIPATLPGYGLSSNRLRWSTGAPFHVLRQVAWDEASSNATLHRASIFINCHVAYLVTLGAHGSTDI